MRRRGLGGLGVEGLRVEGLRLPGHEKPPNCWGSGLARSFRVKGFWFNFKTLNSRARIVNVPEGFGGTKSLQVFRVQGLRVHLGLRVFGLTSKP